jgi:predicted phage-related endonuclease
MEIERYPIDPTKDRATWLALRQRDITASDVPAVCGEGMFGSATKVWAEKLGKVGPQEMTEAMKRGLWGEAAVFEAIGWEFPDWEVRRAKIYLRDPELRLGATPDGAAIIPGLPGITVIQTKVIARPVFRTMWLENPDDDYSPVVAPLAYQLQTLTEGMLADAARSMIVALVVDTFKWELKVVPVERHADAEAVIRDRVGAFWRNHLDTGIQPPVDPERDSEIVKLLFPKDNGLEIDLSHDNELPGLVQNLQDARQAKKSAEESEEIAKTAIAGKMGEVALGQLADGRRISFKTQEREGFTVAPTSMRVLRILKAKKGRR